jgi:DNA-binding transcriptional MerR regulator
VEDPAPAPAEETAVSPVQQEEPLPVAEAQPAVAEAPVSEMPDWITEEVTGEPPVLADNAWPPEPASQEEEEAPAISWQDESPEPEEDEALAIRQEPLSEVIASLEPEEPLDDEEAAAADAAAGETSSAITVEYPEPRLKVEPITGDSILIVAVKHDEPPAPSPATSGEAATEGMNIPPDEDLFKRQYYTMRETAGMFGISHSMLRYWENEFEVLQPRKNKKGDRYFRPVDIKNLQLIHHLLKVRKFTIDGAREYLRQHNKALDTFELVQKLEKMKLFLQELKTHL